MEPKHEKKIHLRILTPTEPKVERDVDMVILRTTGGDMGILPDHETYYCALDYGVFRLINRGKEGQLAVFGGIAEIQDNVLTVLTPEAQWPKDIDRAKSEAICAEIEQRLQREDAEDTGAFDSKGDKARLRRALVRIEVSEHPAPGEDFDVDEQ
ncbi:MAG: ATP synthase F1 subunit epsilon [Oscillospiraceae bacterium]|nr:ATP synthase F1 subunit epsilon [Oscillospiraceae bacterium]